MLPRTLQDTIEKFRNAAVEIFNKKLDNEDDIVNKLFIDTLVNYSLSCELDSAWKKERDQYVDSQLASEHVD